LHHEVAEPLALQRLLQLCMLVRTYDDVMSQSKHSDSYAKHATATSGEDDIGNLDGGTLSLREACNKVIHAREIRPIYDDVIRGVEGQEEPQKLWHLSQGKARRIGRRCCMCGHFLKRC
jgi:hypothetical protein